MFLDCDQSRVMTTGGVAADEDRAADVPAHPFERAPAILQADRKHMLRREPVARGDEGDAGRVEGRRHEAHPFLVAGGPAAAVPEKQHRSMRLRWLEDREPLVRVGSECFLAKGNAGAAAPTLRAVSLARFRKR